MVPAAHLYTTCAPHGDPPRCVPWDPTHPRSVGPHPCTPDRRPTPHNPWDDPPPSQPLTQQPVPAQPPPWPPPVTPHPPRRRPRPSRSTPSTSYASGTNRRSVAASLPTLATTAVLTLLCLCPCYVWLTLLCVTPSCAANAHAHAHARPTPMRLGAMMGWALTHLGAGYPIRSAPPAALSSRAMIDLASLRCSPTCEPLWRSIPWRCMRKGTH